MAEARGKCSCGATYEANGSAERVAIYEASFWAEHHGDGHERVDSSDVGEPDEEQGSLL